MTAKKKILVTGGAGFIGSHLCRKLSKNNHVICIDNLSSGHINNISNLKSNSNFEFIEHDIINPINLKVDEIYNLACPASPKQYQNDPIKTFKTSIIGSLNMLELAKTNYAKILLASTSEVYGDPKVHPQKEDYWGNVNPIGLRSCYDEGKRGAETLFFDYKRRYKLNIKVIRIFNTYGPNMMINDGRVISNFIVQALSNAPITIYGDGKQTRSFQFIDDLIKGIFLMMNSENKISGPINIGNDTEFTITQLANQILKLIPKSESKIIFKALPFDDPAQRKPDIRLAKKFLKWEPQIDLTQGLVKTINYFSKLIIKDK